MQRSTERPLGTLCVTANAIAPGAIETPMTLGTCSDETWENILSMVPTKRRGTSQDIAEAVAYIASPAASYVNGETLTVDGGSQSRARSCSESNR